MAKSPDNWAWLVVEFSTAHKKQAEALGWYLRDHRIAVTLKDVRQMVDATKAGHRWTADDVPPNIPAEHREVVAQLLEAVAGRHKQAIDKRQVQRQRVDDLKRQIPADDRTRLWQLRQGFPSFLLSDDDRRQAELRTLKSIEGWLTMTTAERADWFVRVEANQRERAEAYRNRARTPAFGSPRHLACMVLSVPVDAQADAIKQAYRALVKQHHPDLGGDVAKFKVIQQAYELLLGA